MALTNVTEINATVSAFNTTINSSINSASIFLQVLPKETGWLISAGVAVFILVVFFLVRFLIKE